MEFYEIMINLSIGITGGIFSSIIVSRIFLIHSSHSEQLARVQEHFENTYRLSGTLLFYMYAFQKDENNFDDDTINRFNDALLKDIHEVSKQECEKFRYMIFDDLEIELYKIAVNLNDLMEGTLSLNKVDISIVRKLHKDLFDIQDRFKKYKITNNKHFVTKIKKDKILRILILALVIILISTIISCICAK